MEPINVAYRARFNQHMHRLLATRYRRMAVIAGIISALVSSAGLGVFFSSFPLFGGLLMIASAILSAVAPVLDWNGSHALHASLFHDYRTLEMRVRTMSQGDAEQAIHMIEQREPAESPAAFEKLRALADAITRKELGYVSAA